MIDIFFALDWQIHNFVQIDVQILGWAYTRVHSQSILKFAENLEVGLYSKVGLYLHQYSTTLTDNNAKSSFVITCVHLLWSVWLLR